MNEFWAISKHFVKFLIQSLILKLPHVFLFAGMLSKLKRKVDDQTIVAKKTFEANFWLENYGSRHPETLIIATAHLKFNLNWIDFVPEVDKTSPALNVPLLNVANFGLIKEVVKNQN